MIKFSVVIAVYNKEKHIAKTLQSVLEQTYTHFEVVIVNDGSTDNSEAEIKKCNDPRISYYSQVNQGAGAARNEAIKKAKNDYIALLDADDYWYSHHLEELEKLIAEFPKEHIYANALEVERNGKIFPCLYSIPENSGIQILNYFEASLKSSILHSSNFGIKKAAFNAVGGYNSVFKTGEDTDLYVRLGLNYKVVFGGKITARYQIKDDGLNATSTSFESKATFEAYTREEKNKPALKKFLDLNRYSLAMLAKLQGDDKNYKRFRSQLDEANLNKKQRFLLSTPSGILQLSRKFKIFMERRGIYLSAFK